MILKGEKLWHYLAVKKLSTLLRGITSKHLGDFYCLNCLYPFRTKNKLESHKNLCENKDFCNLIMPSETLKYFNLINIKNLINHYLLFMQILNVQQERLMDVKKNPEN